MTVSRAAIAIAEPLWTNTNHRVNIAVFSDGAKKRAASITGKALKVVVQNPGGATFSYSATAVSASAGTAYITLTGSNHTATGDATLQVRIDGITKEEFTIQFKAKL